MGERVAADSYLGHIQELDEDTLSLDCDSRLERVFKVGPAVCFGLSIVGVVGVLHVLSDELPESLLPWSLAMTGGFFLLAIASYVLGPRLDDSYLISKVRNRLVFRRHFGRRAFRQTVCTLNGIQAVVVGGRRHGGGENSPEWWSYSVYFLTARGRLIEVLGSDEATSIETARCAAGKLSSWLGVQLYPGSRNLAPKAVRRAHGLDIEYGSYEDKVSVGVALGVIVLFVFFLSLLVFVS